MTIKIEDTPLLHPTPELEERLQRLLQFDVERIFGIPAQYRSWAGSTTCAVDADHPRPNYSFLRDLPFNSLYWPTGATRFAAFLALCNRDMVTAVLGTSHSGSSPSTVTLTISDETNTITTELYVLPPRILFQGDVDDSGTIEGSLYCIPLVDARYWWQFSHSNNLEVTSSDGDWSDVYSALGTALGVSITTGTVSANYMEPNANMFSGRYQNPAAILDSAAHSTGRRISRSIGGGVEAMDWDTTALNYAANMAQNHTLVAGGDFGLSSSSVQRYDAHWPGMVKVYCPEVLDGVRNGSGNFYEYSKTPSDAGFSDVKTDSSLVKTFRTTAGATWTGSVASTPTNDTDLGNLATEIAKDYYKSLRQPYDYAFAGVLPWVPTGYDDYILWTCHLGPAGKLTPITRVCGQPYNFSVEEQLSQDGFFPINICVKPGVWVCKVTESGGISSRSNGEVTILDDSYANTSDTFAEAVNWVQTALDENDIVLVQQGLGEFNDVYLITNKDCS